MLRRCLLTCTATAVALLLMTSSASAQFPRGLRFPASLQNLFMLRNEQVQKELKLTDEQNNALSDLSTKLQSEAIEILSGLQDLSPEEQKEAMPELMKTVEAKGKEVQAEVDKVLQPEQLARMKQLSLQSRGAAALEDEEVLAALKVTPEQKEKLTAIREEGAKQLEELMEQGASGGDVGELRKKGGVIRKELSEKAMAILTTAQRDAFTKMQGEKFEFPQGSRFPF